MVFQLTDKLAFPDPHYGDPDGLLAVGGDSNLLEIIKDAITLGCIANLL